MQSASDTPSSHSRRVGAQPKRGLWPLLVAERRRGAGRTGAQQVVALRESRRRGIDPPGITSADATLLFFPGKRDFPVLALSSAKRIRDSIKTSNVQLV